MNSATTRGITIVATPQFVEEQSEPAESRFFWAYTIEIRNDGQETAKLLSRWWHITDALGRTQDVRGPGVVGEQPELDPGEAFRYTSGVPLPTPSGFMQGEYRMVRPNGETFQAVIPVFSLDSPYANNRPN
jgi:ApaG protein